MGASCFNTSGGGGHGVHGGHRGGPDISYAADYPVALIAKIILAQVLVGL